MSIPKTKPMPKRTMQTERKERIQHSQPPTPPPPPQQLPNPCSSPHSLNNPRTHPSKPKRHAKSKNLFPKTPAKGKGRGRGKANSNQPPHPNLLPGMDPNILELVHSRLYSGPIRARSQLATHLPPLHDLDALFKSITSRALELNLDAALEHLEGRGLRIATVYSGTESRLLALEMVKEKLGSHFEERSLEVKHSCPPSLLVIRSYRKMIPLGHLEL
ncbi:hypothetical protein BDV19DRAFT_394108 [Aspergillus venezuelensis]